MPMACRTRPSSAWLGDFGKGFGVSLIALTVLLTIIYAVIRASQRLWWLWGTVVTVVFLALSAC